MNCPERKRGKLQPLTCDRLIFCRGEAYIFEVTSRFQNQDKPRQNWIITLEAQTSRCQTSTVFAHENDIFKASFNIFYLPFLQVN